MTEANAAWGFQRRGHRDAADTHNVSPRNRANTLQYSCAHSSTLRVTRGWSCSAALECCNTDGTFTR